MNELVGCCMEEVGSFLRMDAQMNKLMDGLMD